MQTIQTSTLKTLDAKPPIVPKKTDASSEPADPKDHVALGHTPLSTWIRYGRDIGNVVSDAKTIGSMAVNVAERSAIPTLLKRANAVGVGFGVVGLGLDIYGAKKLFDNPNATHEDKVVDIAHIALTDVVGTAAGSIPLFASLLNPVALGLFIAGTVVAVGFDIYKSYHDYQERHRLGVG